MDSSVETNGLFEQVARRSGRERAVRTPEDTQHLAETCLKISANLNVFDILTRQSRQFDEVEAQAFLRQDGGVLSYLKREIRDGGLKGVDLEKVASEWVEWRQQIQKINEDESPQPFARSVEGVVLASLEDRFRKIGTKGSEVLKDLVLDFDSYPTNTLEQVLVGVDDSYMTAIGIDSNQNQIVNKDTASSALTQRADYISHWQGKYHEKILPFVTRWMRQS